MGKRVQEDLNNTFCLDYRADGAHFATAGLDRKVRGLAPPPAARLLQPLRPLPTSFLSLCRLLRHACAVSDAAVGVLRLSEALM